MLKDYLKVTLPPKSLKYGGMFWATDKMIERFTVAVPKLNGKEQPPVKLYKELGASNDDGRSQILVPRGCCKVPAADYRSTGHPVTYHCNLVPRDEDQIRFIREAKALHLREESFIAEAPTGFGKTAVTMPSIAQVGTTTLIMVHKEDLEMQWRKALVDFLGLKPSEIGILKGDQIRVRGKKVVIGYIQSLRKENRYPKYIYDYFGLVVVDEVHKIGATEFSQAAWLFSAKIWMGLSATPYRKDGHDVVLWAHIGEVKIRITTLQLTPKIIVGHSSFEIPFTYKWDPEQGKKVRIKLPHSAGRTTHITKLMREDDTRNDMICEFVASAYKIGRYTVILSDTKAHLTTLEECLVSWGIPRREIAYYVGGMSDAAREKAKTKRVCLATYAMVDTGTNNPIWSVGVLATPRADVVQLVGRVLRVHETKCCATKPVEGKHTPIILDILDSDSKVFMSYFKKRLKYYEKIKAPIVK